VELRAAIVQDAETNRVLMLAWMNDEAERLTRETGEAWFWSRSRQQLWRKGATSGNTLAVEELRDDCDGDALLVRVRPAGPACHTASLSCFAPALWRTISERALERPAGSYTTELLEAGVGASARKLGEAVELAVAALSKRRARDREAATRLPPVRPARRAQPRRRAGRGRATARRDRSAARDTSTCSDRASARASTSRRPCRHAASRRASGSATVRAHGGREPSGLVVADHVRQRDVERRHQPERQPLRRGQLPRVVEDRRVARADVLDAD
jgi:phosphoribosyl-ATP pyrophosphohydrolase/phosphoribosyl-AMP cyclohydrolase